MAVILDLGIFIAAERSKVSGGLRVLLESIAKVKPDDEALISVVTASELLMGVHRAVDERIRGRRSAFVEAILDQFASVPIDLRIAREHSRLSAGMIASGQRIGTHDSWIAATGLSNGFSIGTTNVREFERVPGLEVIGVEI
jgi:tRNA(fMet)-specific endonuclease VapC